MKHLISLSLLIFSAVSAQASSLQYDYLQVGLGIGKVEVDQLNRSYDFKARGFELIASRKLSENFYVIGGADQSNLDDKDVNRGVLLDVDSDSRSIYAAAGYIQPLAEGVDLIAELGAAHSKVDYDGRTNGLPFNASKSDTDLRWALGIRTEIAFATELAFKYSRAGDRSELRISGPVYFNDSLGLDLGYSLVKDRTHNLDYDASIISIGLRINI